MCPVAVQLLYSSFALADLSLFPLCFCRYVLYLLYLSIVAFVMAYVEVTLLSWTGALHCGFGNLLKVAFAFLFSLAVSPLLLLLDRWATGRPATEGIPALHAPPGGGLV